MAASSDLAGYLDTYDVPGVEVSATDVGVVDIRTAMAELAPSDCMSAGREPDVDPLFEGEIEFFIDCGGTDTVFVSLAAAYKPEPSRIALLQAQIVTERDLDALSRILDTFAFT